MYLILFSFSARLVLGIYLYLPGYLTLPVVVPER